MPCSHGRAGLLDCVVPYSQRTLATASCCLGSTELVLAVSSGRDTVPAVRSYFNLLQISCRAVKKLVVCEDIASSSAFVDLDKRLVHVLCKLLAADCFA